MLTYINCLNQSGIKVTINKLQAQMMNWHLNRFPDINNTPNTESNSAIISLCSHILQPIQNEFGKITITYGFTSHPLLLQIKKHAPQHIAPNIDQHSSYEVNTKGNIICNRGGAACDISVSGFENNMFHVAKWVNENMPFDRMYLYGKNRPIHISFGAEQNRFIQVMKTNKVGKRFPGKKGSNVDFISLIGDNNE